MSASTLPPCGLYRTTAALGEVPAGRLVYFHNHGEPGPGVYLPDRWKQNRAVFADRGHTLPEPYAASALQLEPLVDEGFYRVRETFACCEKRCRIYEPGLFVQLGYDGNGSPIVFTPELGTHGLALPEIGQPVAIGDLGKLDRLAVAESTEPAEARSSRRENLH